MNETKMTSRKSRWIAGALTSLLMCGGAAMAQNAYKFDAATVSGLPARNIGSATMSGRVAAVDAVEQDGRITVFVGSASGGVWKSVNGGTTYKPVFDRQSAQSIGAVTIDPSNPKTVWVGTGEAWVRNSVSVGDGVYKSTDSGENWTNVGLKNSEHIAKILVDPKDGNNVVVCAMGHLWDDNEERGVYQDVRRREDLEQSSGGSEWIERLRAAGDEQARTEDDLCVDVGLPAARLDVSIGRAGKWAFQIDGRWRSLERDSGQQREGTCLRSRGDAWRLRLRHRSRTWCTPTSKLKKEEGCTAPMMGEQAGQNLTPVTSWCGVHFISAT